MDSPIRLRFAPSPTGELHLGSARTALYNFLFARNQHGHLILRVEDTDQTRFVPGSMDRFIEDLRWLGITFDEGPIIQSDHADRHREIAHELVLRGAAYYDFSSQAGVGARSEDEYRSGRGVYRSPDRTLELADAKRRVDSGEPFVIRLKVPDSGTIAFDDLVRGRIEFDFSTVDDTVLLKSDGMATYHLAAMVDDHDMQITHVMRSEEWLPSTPKHLFLIQSMGWGAPKFAHLSFILAPDGKKLSKRLHGETVWVGTYRKRGYLPTAIINYIALLGWNPGQDREFMTESELIESFSLERLHKAGAIFDQAKLDAFQRHYVQQLSVEDLSDQLRTYFSDQQLEVPERELFDRMVMVIHDRLGAFEEFSAVAAPFMTLAEYDSSMLVFKKSTPENTRAGLAAAVEVVTKLDEAAWTNHDALQAALASTVTDNRTNGDVFWPVRVALTGLLQSPSPVDCLWVLGRAESLRRLAVAQEKIQGLQ